MSQGVIEVDTSLVGLQENVWRRKEKHRGERGGGVEHAECAVLHEGR